MTNLTKFSALDSLDLLAAFICQKYGEDALRQTFSMVENLYREPLEQAADVLAAKGLSHVANIMADIASNCPSELTSNPYPPDSFNGRYWAQSWLQRQWQTSSEFEKHLRAQRPRNSIKPKPYMH